jgi:hypothetical protein
MIFLNVKGTKGSLLIPPLFGSDSFASIYKNIIDVL